MMDKDSRINFTSCIARVTLPWSLVWLLAACPALAAEVVLAGDAIPSSIVQGGLLRGSVPAGSHVELLAGSGEDTADGVEVRVDSAGRFVIGVGRDEAGPLSIAVIGPDGRKRVRSIPVSKRQWRIERVQGVPQATVNPPPAIAERIAREQALVSAARERDDDRADYAVTFSWPLRGRISGVYGSQRIYNGTPKSAHSGLDVAAAKGTSIRAPAGGVVTFASPNLYLTGGTVLIDHGHGVSSNFLHMSRLDVAVGDRVEQGQVIGLVGATGRATGPHMHWGMNWFGVRVDPQLLLESTATAEP